MTVRGGGDPLVPMAPRRDLEWARHPELRRRCVWLHHGRDPDGSAEYKVVTRGNSLTGELPLDDFLIKR